MPQTYTHYFERFPSAVEIGVEYVVDSWGFSAVTWGPPEACDIGSPIEISLVKAWIEPSGEATTLTQSEWETIEGAIRSDPPERFIPEEWD